MLKQPSGNSCTWLLGGAASEGRASGLPSRKVGVVKCASCTHILKTGQDGMSTAVNITEVSASSCATVCHNSPPFLALCSIPSTTKETMFFQQGRHFSSQLHTVLKVLSTTQKALPLLFSSSSFSSWWCHCPRLLARLHSPQQLWPSCPSSSSFPS